ncbi:MAG: MarR family transcriptional regulator [Acetobacteraceae bacterium]|nr:MarR family transcriptional regulator [Acetobacteraceae bacterium]
MTLMPPRLPPAPPPAVMKELRRCLAGRELQALEAVFTLRMTAQQGDNAIAEWMSGTAGSTARYQILMLLWAARGSAVPHKDIVAALGVTRATVSGLMAALEREGLIRSCVDRDDRRQLLASLTSRGETVMSKAVEVNTTRLRAAFACLSSAELATLTALLHRLREGFAATTNAAKAGKHEARSSD